MDKFAVVWTRLGSQPIKMGTLVVTDTQTRFTYESNYRDTGLKGLGLVYDPNEFTTTISRNRNEYFDLHPPLQALVPPRSERNFQRALLLKYLASINIKPKPGLDTDWELLTLAGHGSIGHLDVFASDEAAIQWYSTPSRRGLVELDDKFGFSLKEFMTWFDEDAKAILDILGPTPSIGGAIPKLSLSIPRTGWDGRIGLPTKFGDTGRTDIILKLENINSYPGIIDLEMLGLQIHKDAGFEVPRYWHVQVNGLNALAIERFDRDALSKPYFMESVYSVLASGSQAITNHYSATYDFIGRALLNRKIQLTSDHKAATRHLVERLVLAMLTGNGDLHLENLAFLERQNKVTFSPVFDPTPMRAYQIHNMITPPGMTWGDYGDYPDDLGGSDKVDFQLSWYRFLKSLDVSFSDFKNIVSHMLHVTTGYEEKIHILPALPIDNKVNLQSIYQNMKQQFERFLM